MSINEKIYHRLDDGVDLVAADFSQRFIIRKFCGHDSINQYATLRVCGFDGVSSFIVAFSAFFGHPEAIQHAASAFETTPAFRNAVVAATELLGTARIKHELEQRCNEVSSWTADAARLFRIEFGNEWAADNGTNLHRIASDETAYVQFASKRREEREKAAAKDRFGNSAPEWSHGDE
ncbi:MULTISPECIES: hypothetical protein [Paraburkholderia]|jgi:hypothetical protein|uniref:hypothetical protein n=1 Tax=Paraburkholderia TaxID=1822464 RepID=UPI0038BD96BE